MARLQLLIVPVLPGDALLMTSSVQGPFSGSPVKAARDSSGWKVPVNGGIARPDVMLMVALSSKTGIGEVGAGSAAHVGQEDARPIGADQIECEILSFG